MSELLDGLSERDGQPVPASEWEGLTCGPEYWNGLLPAQLRMYWCDSCRIPALPLDWKLLKARILH